MHEARAFNIATSKETTVLELADTVGRVMGVKPVLEFAPPRPGELLRSALDVRKAGAPSAGSRSSASRMACPS